MSWTFRGIKSAHGGGELSRNSARRPHVSGTEVPLSTAILTILTIAAVVSAVINLEQQYHFRLPEDGVIWVDRSGGVKPLRPLRQPRRQGGIHEGDRLTDNQRRRRFEKAVDVPKVTGRHRALEQGRLNGGPRRAWKSRSGSLIVGEVPFDRAVMYQYMVGLAYLVIGLFVYFRRGSAHKAQHFYILCLTSFIFFCFHYTGKLNSSIR